MSTLETDDVCRDVSTQARGYVAAGFALVPIPRGKKGPRQSAWQRQENAITTEEAASRLDGCNIGLAHRWSSPPTCSIDIDDLEKARLWFLDHGVDIDMFLDTDNAVQVTSGRINRAKLLYRLPECTSWLATHKLRSGVEFRCADKSGESTVQDVLPPSIHPDTGNPYQWAGKGDWRNIPILPDALLELWHGLASDLVDEQTDGKQAGLISEGGRNDFLASVAGSMRRKGLGLEELEDALRAVNEKVCVPPLSMAEVATIVHSIGRYPPADMRVNHNSLASIGRLREVDLLEAMSSELPEPGFLLSPLLPRGQVSLLGGHGGIGKSMLGLTIAAHISAGRSFAGFMVDAPAKVVFISLEDDQGVVLSRLRRIVDHFQLPESVFENLRVFDCSGGYGALMTEAPGAAKAMEATPLMAEVVVAVVAADLVFIDNASEAFDGNENVRRQVRQFIGELREIGRENNAAVVLIAHIDKAAALRGSRDNSYSGSTAWHNSARSRLALVTADDGGIELRHEKSNYAQLAEPVRFLRMDFGILEPMAAGVREAMRKEQFIADDHAVLNALLSAETRGKKITTAMSGSTTSWRVLNVATEMPPALSEEGRGKKRVDAALMRLEKARIIRRAMRRDHNRKQREIWEVCDLDVLAMV